MFIFTVSHFGSCEVQGQVPEDLVSGEGLWFIDGHLLSEVSHGKSAERVPKSLFCVSAYKSFSPV